MICGGSGTRAVTEMPKTCRLSIFKGLFVSKRTVERETRLHGERLRVGEKVALAFGSGNRDRRKFPNPDVYDIERRPQGHLGFGAGKHFCLGSQMARLVTEVAMKRFLKRVPQYHLTADHLTWNSSSNFRSPVALPFAIN